MNDSPLYRDTLALAGVLHEELAGVVAYPAVCQRLEQGALRLLDLVALALAGFDRVDHLIDADAELHALRAQVDLAHELALLDDETFLGFEEQGDRIGRQIGGWLKKLRRDDQPQNS